MDKRQRLTLKFLSMLYGRCDEGFVELRPLTGKYKPYSQGRGWFPVNDLTSLTQEAWQMRDKLHLFFGVTTRNKKSKKIEKATKKYLRELPALFADLDFEDYKGGKEEAREIVNDFAFPPSCLVSSGNGYHCYYFLEDPYNTKNDEPKVTRLLKALQDSLLQADSTSDLTRVLRLPYSLNLKEPKHPKLVEIERLENNRYRLKDIMDQLWPWLQEEENELEGKIKGQLEEANLELDENGEIKVGKLEVSDKIKSLIVEGKTKNDEYPSRSEADQAVITALLSAGYPEKEITEIFKQYPEGIGEKFYSKGSSREQYLEHSINSAKDFLRQD